MDGVGAGGVGWRSKNAFKTHAADNEADSMPSCGGKTGQASRSENLLGTGPKLDVRIALRSMIHGMHGRRRPKI